MAEIMAMDQVGKELFDAKMGQVAATLASIEAKLDKFATKFDRVDSDIQQINLTMAKQNVEQLAREAEALDKRVEALEVFKVKVLTSLIVLQIMTTLLMTAVSVWSKAR